MARLASRDGYVLLAVLWICMGITALSALLLGASRAAVAASGNRTALAAAGWNATACLAHARAVLMEAAREDRRVEPSTGSGVWSRVDRVLEASPPPAVYACRRSAIAVGSRLDVNAADAGTLARLYAELGMPTPRADSVALATVSRKPFVNARQLRLVPGLATLAGLDILLDVEPGPIAVNHAASQVLALIPGFTAELVSRIMDARRRGTPITAFVQLSEGLSSDARDSLSRYASGLPSLISLHPSAWVITARSVVGHPPVTAVAEARLAWSGGRTMLVRRRSWVE